MIAVTHETLDFVVLGEVDAGGNARSPVTVLELTETSCRLREKLLEVENPTTLNLWLGAIGPLRGHLSSTSHDCIEFDGAIHSSIVEHFRS